jgi:hypothetical protein
MIDWMRFKVRSKWLSASLQLVVLLALRGRPMNEWELSDDIYRKTGLVPEESEFRRTIRLLIGGGFVQVQREESQPRMSVNARGLQLLSELEGFQRECFKSIGAPEGGSRSSWR